MSTTLPPPTSALTASDTARPGWYRALRIAISLSPLLAVHFALLASPWVDFTWWALLMMVVTSRITGLGITVGLHRYFSHRAFKTSRWFQFVLGVMGCTALQKGPLWWTIHHRLHHIHSDHEHDPHSPVLEGFWHGHMGWIFSQDLMTPDKTIVRDLTKYPELVWLDRLWMLPGVLLGAACYGIMGWPGLVYGFCLSTVLVFHITFAVNSVGHLWGPQPYETNDGSRNNPLVGILAMGEGWHNNHHRAPSSARLGFRWYELDVGYQFIRLLAWCGLVWDVKQPSAALLEGRHTPSAPQDAATEQAAPAALDGPDSEPEELVSSVPDAA